MTDVSAAATAAGASGGIATARITPTASSFLDAHRWALVLGSALAVVAAASYFRRRWQRRAQAAAPPTQQPTRSAIPTESESPMKSTGFTPQQQHHNTRPASSSSQQGSRKQQLDAQRQAAMERLQGQMDRAGAEWRAHEAERKEEERKKEEARRHKQLQYLEEEEVRLGFKHKGEGGDWDRGKGKTE
ncbi:hypothetical protein CLOP_g7100 [Closterium sp. NIES-67]|nr:hypothetical protein CLOP_g7100 [Closterium sp. NIES-67]